MIGGTDKSGNRRPLTGSGEHTYEVFHDWGEKPARIAYGNTHGVVQDSHADRERGSRFEGHIARSGEY